MLEICRRNFIRFDRGLVLSLEAFSLNIKE